jgi:hypothetical protein
LFERRRPAPHQEAVGAARFEQLASPRPLQRLPHHCTISSPRLPPIAMGYSAIRAPPGESPHASPLESRPLIK